MKRICVFAGSNSGSHIEYLAAARELGRALVQHEVGLVYGGARVGLMGALADAVLGAGGHVTGVIPEALLAKEAAHRTIRSTSASSDANTDQWSSCRALPIHSSSGSTSMFHWLSRSGSTHPRRRSVRADRFQIVFMCRQHTSTRGAVVIPALACQLGVEIPR